MRTMLFSVGAVVTLSAFGVAYAGEGEAVVFTQIEGVVAQTPAQNVAPVAMAEPDLVQW